MAKWSKAGKVSKLSPMERLFGYGIIRTSKSVDMMTNMKYQLKKKR